MKVADEDLERALRNWGRWKNGGGGIASSFPLTEFVIRDPWAAPPPPIINGEAMDMDEVIETLPSRYQEVIRVRYALDLGPEAAARRCRCVVQTFYNRLESAWEMIRVERAKRFERARARGEQARAAHEAARAMRFAS